MGARRAPCAGAPAEWLGRDLSAIDLVVLMIDGAYVGDEHVMLVALGFDAQRNKHVLGVREGATENTASCTALLTDMRERGLHTDRAILAVVAGWKLPSRMSTGSSAT